MILAVTSSSILYIVLAVLFVVLLFLYTRVRGNRIRRGGS